MASTSAINKQSKLFLKKKNFTWQRRNQKRIILRPDLCFCLVNLFEWKMKKKIEILSREKDIKNTNAWTETTETTEDKA